MLEDVEKVKMERSCAPDAEQRSPSPRTSGAHTHIQNSLLEMSLTPSVREHLRVGCKSNFKREEKGDPVRLNHSDGADMVLVGDVALGAAGPRPSQPDAAVTLRLCDFLFCCVGPHPVSEGGGRT